MFSALHDGLGHADVGELVGSVNSECLRCGQPSVRGLQTELNDAYRTCHDSAMGLQSFAKRLMITERLALLR